MTPLELAQKYMECVFKSGDFEGLRAILADNLQFKGPLYCFNTADDYVNSLINDPPTDFVYKIIRTYSDSSSACLIYNFSKPGVTTLMAQTFFTDNKKIKSILLVFDSKVF
jgi:hypothetical protein